jgi:DNA-binding NtrC family response regulator
MRRTSSIETLPPLLDPSAPFSISVVIYHRDGPRVVPLAADSPFVIGRAIDADVSIQEPTLSRRHARLELEGMDVYIEDLGSSNGTRVNGKTVKRARVSPSDHVALGAVTLSIHTTESLSPGLKHHYHFMTTLEEELVRSRTLGHQLCVLLVRPASERDAQRFKDWFPRLQQHLRPVDRIALHSPGVVEVLLPESGILAAVRLAEQIVGRDGFLRCGVALFPAAAKTAEGLVGACLDALKRTSDTDPIVTDAAGVAEQRAPEVELDQVGSAMRPVFQMIERVAPSDLPVLIYGETGTGKEVVARAIHQSGPRRERTMRCINCGAIPRDLVQSTLFGHERGSFTGASQQRQGVFEEADGSTLLLDEVGELPAEAQVSLLRVLETGRLSRVGSSLEIPVDVRVISATHRNLEELCHAGVFRRDLLYRLNTITLKVPPLRERLDEIVPLAEHFIAKASEYGGQPPKTIEPGAMELLARYPWPGNVRELRNAMERAVLVANSHAITASDLPSHVRAALEPTVRCLADETPALGHQTADSSEFKQRVRRYEIQLLYRALEQTGWNKKAAARELRIPLRTLMYKVQSHGLGPGRPPEDDTDRLLPIIDEGADPPDFKARIRAFECSLLTRALEASGWNKAEAARQLGLPLSTVLYKIKSYGLRPGN